MDSARRDPIKVQVGCSSIVIDQDRTEHEAKDRDLYKNLVDQWAKAIASLDADGDAVGIPLDTEFVEFSKFVLCLLAIRQQEQIVVRGAWFNDDWFEWENAYVFDARCDRDKLIQGNFSTPRIFGPYNLQLFVDGLLNAELI